MRGFFVFEYLLTMSLDNDFYHREPDLCFHLTDTAGGPESILGRQDPEAQITIHIRSGHSRIVRLFHFFGRVPAISYVVAETSRLIREDLERRPNRKPRKVVIVGNAAPRDDDTNDVEFHMGRVGAHLQVIAPPHAFSLVKDQLTEGFHRLPNDNGVVFPPGDQFRSSYVEEVATDPMALVPAETSVIPDPPDYPTLGYVDFFGNLKLLMPDGEEFQRKLEDVAVNHHDGKIVGLQIGDNRLDVSLALSLGEAKPGQHVLYRNGGRGDQYNVAWVWPKNISDTEKQSQSPHAKLGEPPEGAPISIR